MITLEINNDTFLEIKDLARNFLDHALKDVEYEAKHPEELELIGMRMLEILQPEEYKQYYWKLCDAVHDEIIKEGDTFAHAFESAKELRKDLTKRLTDYKGNIDKVIEKVVDIGVPYIKDQLDLDGVEARLRIVVLDWFFDTYGLVINEPYNHRLTHSLFTDLKNIVNVWWTENH